MNAMDRRRFMQASLLGAGSLCTGVLRRLSHAEPSHRRSRPNIIFIMTDDHAAHALSCYGSRINETPNLDRIANEGMRFDNCFCTNSICAPSRAVILTGKYSHVNGVTDNRRVFDGSRATFPALLRDAGYETAMIGKWHLKSEPVGFDYWNILPGQGAYYNPDLIEMGERKRYEGYCTDIITDVCLSWLKNRRTDRPFCLMFHHKAPHRNWQPGPEHLTMYDDTDIPEPETLFDDYSTRSEAAREQAMTVAEHLYFAYDLKVSPPRPDDETDRRLWKNTFGRLTGEQKKRWNEAYGPGNEAFREAGLRGRDLVRWRYQRYIKDYLRCIASVDDNVGRLLDHLDSSGLAENTVVVYTSDQGFFLGDHGWFDKRFMYEEALRMPLLIRYPGVTEPGSVNDDIVLNLDFAPTFLDIAGVPVPGDMQGRSLLPLLEGETPRDWRTSMYYHYYEYPGAHSVKRHYGVRTRRYKLIHFYYDIDAWELYDLERDPDELNNVYDDPSYAGVVNELKSELEQLRRLYGDSDELAKRILEEDLARARKR